MKVKIKWDPNLAAGWDVSKCRTWYFSFYLIQRKLHESDYMLSGEPLLTFKTDPAEPMPSCSDYRWQAHAERRRETLRQLAGWVKWAVLLCIATVQPCFFCVLVVILRYLFDRIHPNPQTCLVTGADYWKYYKRFGFPLHILMFWF